MLSFYEKTQLVWATILNNKLYHITLKNQEQSEKWVGVQILEQQASH